MTCFLSGCGNAEPDRAARMSEPTLETSEERIRAVTLDARREPSDSVLLAIRDLGATHVTLVSFGFQSEADVPEIRFSPDVRWYSESARGTKALANRAAKLGMGVILKPQMWLRGGAWTADIDFASEDDWLRWESDYREYLMYTAGLAEEVDAALLVVGTELGNPVRERSAFWRDLIRSIRDVYDGRLTYAANWHADYEEVPFWDALDYIGVQAYFPISEDDDPTLSELSRGWSDHVRVLAALSSRANLPVLFTEIGYRSVSYAAEEPWRWPSRDESVRPDFQLQADLYRAFFEVVWSQPWFAGAMIWKYYPLADGRRYELDFTPQGKPAERVIRRGFQGMTGERASE